MLLDIEKVIELANLLRTLFRDSTAPFRAALLFYVQF